MNGKTRLTAIVTGIVPTLALVAAVARPASGLSTTTPRDRGPTCGPAWEIEASPSPGTIGNSLSKVVSLSAADAWAVGSQISAPGDRWKQTTLSLHWDGTAWSEFPTHQGFVAGLSAVRAFSSNDVWAVGSRFRDLLDSLPLVEHFDGTSWSVVPAPRIPLGNLFGVDGTSSSDLWAVGTVRSGTPAMLIVHFDGSAWAVVPAPPIDSDYVQLSSIEVTGPADAWAVGYFLDRRLGTYQHLVVHYDGTSWELVETPEPGRGDRQLFDVVATGPGTVWVVGQAGDGSRARPLAMLLEDGRWHLSHTPQVGYGDAAFAGVAAGADGTMWAVGTWSDQGGVARTLVERYLDGAWGVMESPNASEEENALSSVSIGPDGDVWAVGSYNPHSVGQTLTEHLCP